MDTDYKLRYRMEKGDFGHPLEDAIDVAFGFSLDYGDMSRCEARDMFKSLEIGETLEDEDHDTWVRMEDVE